MECTAGLRLINNNYTSDGSGRDRMMFQDAGFRGGREQMRDLPVHQKHCSNARAPGSGSNKVPMESYWNKFQTRPFNNSSRQASLITNKLGLAESRKFGSNKVPMESYWNKF